MLFLWLRKPRDTIELPQLQALVDDETSLVDLGSGFGAGSPWIRYV